MKKIAGVIMAGLLCASSQTYAKETKVSLTSKSYKEITVADKKGHKVKKLIDTKKVLPGDTIVYENVVHNGTDKAVKNMVLNNPIPKEVAYIEGSAACEKKCKILFSVDHGKVFAEPSKLMVKGKNGMHPAHPDEYTDIRWILQEPLPGHRQVKVSYKAKLR